MQFAHFVKLCDDLIKKQFLFAILLRINKKKKNNAKADHFLHDFIVLYAIRVWNENWYE